MYGFERNFYTFLQYTYCVMLLSHPTLVQLLQKLNLMDYSLLVGIHDCTAALPAEEEERMENWYDEDGNEYISSDEVVEPVSPSGIIISLSHYVSKRSYDYHQPSLTAWKCMSKVIKPYDFKHIQPLTLCTALGFAF